MCVLRLSFLYSNYSCLSSSLLFSLISFWCSSPSVVSPVAFCQPWTPTALNHHCLCNCASKLLLVHYWIHRSCTLKSVRPLLVCADEEERGIQRRQGKHYWHGKENMFLWIAPPSGCRATLIVRCVYGKKGMQEVLPLFSKVGWIRGGTQHMGTWVEPAWLWRSGQGV